MKEIRCNSPRAWLLAARPKTLTAAIIPVLVGTALAFSAGSFQWLPALICLLFAGLMQIVANFINDLFDFKKGSDRADRLGPDRACAAGWITPRSMSRGILLTLLTACLVGSTLLLYAGWELLVVGAICALFAFLYTAGPYPLSYNGWGDLLVIIFFGFVPVGGTYYVQAHTWTCEVTMGALLCGLLIDTLLVVNNYRDREADAISGKRTVVVRFGKTFGSNLYLALGLLAVLICGWFFTAGYLLAIIPGAFYLPLHYATWKRMIWIGSGKNLNSILGETSRNMLILGIILSVALALMPASTSSRNTADTLLKSLFQPTLGD